MGVDKGTLIMYDAQTRSRWSQLFGSAVSGPMEGQTLAKLPSTMTTWGKWRETHPDTTVYVKPSIPYNRRFTQDSFARIAAGDEGPVRSNDLIVGVEGHVEARAYLVRRLAKDRLVNDTLEAAPILVYLSEDLATARVFDRKLEGKTLTFLLVDGTRLQDEETGSSWNPDSGQAISGPLQGKQLPSMISTYSLWFAWKKYRPDTVISGEASTGDASR